MKRLLEVIMLVWVFALAPAIIMACSLGTPAATAPCQTAPAAHAVAFTFTVRVAVDTCTEDRNAVLGGGEYATIDCQGDGGIYRILFPRKEWLDMKRDGTGAINAGPGK